MFTQLFGHYLLNKGVVTAQQLQAALEAMANTRVRMGALAIDAGIMTAEQVDAVHAEQRHVDKRFGNIAVDMGYITSDQVCELLAKQQTANIVLGQALIDNGSITNAQFQEALNDYKSSSVFDDSDDSDERLAKDLTAIFALNEFEDSKFYIDYLLLLVRNVVRFIGDDFAFSGCKKVGAATYNCLCAQDITGAVSGYTAIGCDEKPFTSIASRYAVDSGEEADDAEEFGLFSEVDEFVEACVGEFLNLQNGLYAVNVSNATNTELDLTPQISARNAEVKLDGGIAVTLDFSFGSVDFIIIKK